MKKIVLAVFMAAMALSLSAQINFREGGFAEALEAAKSENKLVFMDCYTSWCGPCKLMASKEFVQEKAGEYFNPRFVSVKIDMEKGEGVELRKRYDVNAYPTLLVLNVKGELLCRHAGYLSVDELIDTNAMPLVNVHRNLSENTWLYSTMPPCRGLFVP